MPATIDVPEACFGVTNVGMNSTLTSMQATISLPSTKPVSVYLMLVGCLSLSQSHQSFGIRCKLPALAGS